LKNNQTNLNNIVKGGLSICILGMNSRSYPYRRNLFTLTIWFTLSVNYSAAVDTNRGLGKCAAYGLSH